MVSETRTAHTSSIHREILEYLRPSEEVAFSYGIPAHLARDKRGMNHHATARFLIPRRHLDEYEAAQQRYSVTLLLHPTAGPHYTHNNSTIDKFAGGESADYMLVAEEWPTFLYDETAGWSITNIRKGLFRGHILARVSSISSASRQPTDPNTQVALRMYRNRTAVTNEVIGEFFNPKTSQGQGRPSFVKKHGISKVIPEMIAYAAIQVRRSNPAEHSHNATSADLCGPVVHAIMGRHGWDLQSHPLLPPHHTDPLR